MVVIDLISIVLLIAGTVFFMGAAIGVLRFPDLYTRLHAASKGDTLSSFCLLLGCALYNVRSLDTIDIIVSLKIILILGLVSISSPTAAQSIADAAYSSGIEPWTKSKPQSDTRVDL